MDAKHQGDISHQEGGERQQPDAKAWLKRSPGANRLDLWLVNGGSTWIRYGAAILAVVVALLVDEEDFLHGEFRIYLVFYPFIIIATLYGGLGPGLLAIALSCLAVSFFWAEPVGSLAVAARADIISIAIFIVGNLLFIWICERLRRAIRQAAQAEAYRESAEELARQAEIVKESEERSSLAQKAGQVGIFDWDILSGKIIWTPEQEELFDLPPGGFEQTYDAWVKRIHPKDEARLTPYFKEWMESDREEEKECQEYRIPLPDGQMRWIEARGRIIRDASGRAVRMIGTNRDVTNQKRAETALRESETRYRTIFETAVDAIIHIDEQGIIAAANPAAEKLFGYKFDEMEGRNVKMLMPSPYQEHHDEYLDNYRRTGDKKIIGIGRDVVGLRKDGTAFPIHLAVSEMWIGEKRMFTGLVHDITESKQAESILHEAKEIAETANRAKDRLVAIISHELRTPLTPALMTVSACESDMTLTSEVRGDLGTIRRNLELEARLIDDLLDLNRLARGKVILRLQTRDLHQVLRNALEICRGEIEARRLKVQLDLTAPEHNVNGDSGRLQQVFWNLLKNATKFTSAGGAITIRSSNPDPEVIRVEVSDTGIGIAPQMIAHLFEPFEQGAAEITQQFGGMGLGLAISKAVVDMHEGKIWGASEGQGKGATFAVELLITRSKVLPEEDARPSALLTAWKSKIGDRKLRVLLVEDNVDTLQTLGRLLERKGCSVIAAESMGAALAAAQAAREGTEKFDLVVSDLALPDGDGRDLMRELHNRDGLPGIALSGYGMEEDIEKSLAAGFAKHLTKPIQIEELQVAISELVGHLVNETQE